jgi:pyruvate dehydrogenase E1 component alpha subunit
MAKAKISKKTYLEWYEIMLKARKFEEKAGMLYGQQKIRGFCHLYIGQEALAAGLITATKKQDPIITAYRCHALALARGMTANAGMAELFGKVDGCVGGKGGSMHFFDKENYFMGGHGIVGAQIGLGTGIAFAEKYKGTDNVTLAMFGDGATWQGILHESFNLAKIWELPVIFIVENNGYAMGTSVERSAGTKDMFELGHAFGIKSMAVDGMDVEAVHNVVSEMAEMIRKKPQPVFLEIRTYRYKGHSMSDPQKYRTKEEVESYKALDPIEQVLNTIKKKKYASDKEIKAIQDKIKKEIDECVTFAENSEFPKDSAVYEYIYSEDNYPFIKN